MLSLDVKNCIGESAGYMAIGFFDTLHVGHRKVIERAVTLARENHTISSVFLFKNNIYGLIGMKKSPLFSFEERLKEVEALGVDKVFYLEADAGFLSLSPQAFVTFLREKLRIEGTICGADFTYGQGGAGKAADLLRAFPKGAVVELCYDSGEKVSTSLLKKLLLHGDVRSVCRMLGRPFAIRERVVSGRSEGKKMGFPTINMPFPSGTIKGGVYISETVIGSARYPSLTNIGGHPTYNDAHENAETYILDYSGSLYGEMPEVRLLDYLREIKKFDTVEALIAQIEKDVETRRKYDSVRTIGD